MLKALRPPPMAWIAVILAGISGWFAYQASPEGIYLYTPRDWCQGHRSHPFGMGCVAFLTVAAALCVAAWALGVTEILLSRDGSAGSRMADLSMKALASCLLFAVAAILAPRLEWAMPLKADPACHRARVTGKQRPRERDSHSATQDVRHDRQAMERQRGGASDVLAGLLVATI